MSNQIDNAVRKTNRFAIKSLAAGFLSLLLYALSLPLIFGIDGDAWKIIALIVSIGGIYLCVISLNASNESLKQFKGADNVERGYGIAITGRMPRHSKGNSKYIFCILLFFGFVAQ